MPKCFFFYAALLGLSFAKAQFSYKELFAENNDGIYADRAICVNQSKQQLVYACRDASSGNISIREYIDLNEKKINFDVYSRAVDPHEIISLKNGGYALGGRDIFLLINSDLSIKSSIGHKMLDWRASNTGMDYWKCGTGGSTGTAVDFLELAENPSGTLVASLFIWHKMESGGRQAIRLGLAVADMNNEGKSKIYDLDVETYSGSHNPIEASEEVEIGFLDDKHLLIANSGDNNATEPYYMIVDASLIAAGTPLEALKWKGKLNDEVPRNFITNKGVVYYVHYGNTVGKALWDGKKLTIKTEYKYNTRVSSPLEYIEDFDDQYFLVMTGYGDFYKVSKSDLGLTFLSRLNTKYSNYFLDVKPLDAAKNQVVVLMRENANSSSPGPFHLGILQLK